MSSITVEQEVRKYRISIDMRTFKPLDADRIVINATGVVEVMQRATRRRSAKLWHLQVSKVLNIPSREIHVSEHCNPSGHDYFVAKFNIDLL